MPYEQIIAAVIGAVLGSAGGWVGGWRKSKSELDKVRLELAGERELRNEERDHQAAERARETEEAEISTRAARIADLIDRATALERALRNPDVMRRNVQEAKKRVTAICASARTDDRLTDTCDSLLDASRHEDVNAVVVVLAGLKEIRASSPATPR
jgi:hypothetical protein